MDIIPACCAAPDDFFLLGLEFHEADRTVAFDGPALALVVVGLGLSFAGEGGVFEDVAEFLYCGEFCG